MTVASNPRILAAFAMAIVLLGAGVGALFVLGFVVGLIAMAAVLFVDWTLLRLVRRQLATRIETTDESITFTLVGAETVPFPWEKIRVSGTVTASDTRGRSSDKRGRGSDKRGRSSVTRGRGRHRDARLFVYNETDDRMISIPAEYENIDALEAELRSRTDFRELTLDRGETLKDKLRELVGQG
jgi:hypothetical protein